MDGPASRLNVACGRVSLGASRCPPQIVIRYAAIGEMMLTSTNADRFRMARERAGLTVFEVARRIGLSDASVFDLESYADELLMVYGPADLTRFSYVLGTTPANLLGVGVRNDPLGAAELATAVQSRCATLGVTISEFEDRCGWHLAEALQQPEKFLVDYSIDGIKDVCKAAGVEWERFIIGLRQAA